MLRSFRAPKMADFLEPVLRNKGQRDRHCRNSGRNHRYHSGRGGRPAERLWSRLDGTRRDVWRWTWWWRRLLSPDAQYEAYKQSLGVKGQEQWVDALELAAPEVRLKYVDEHPTPGTLIASKTQDATGRIITRYHGSQSWRRAFKAPAIPCIMKRPRGR
jgi:hypothetical protein